MQPDRSRFPTLATAGARLCGKAAGYKIGCRCGPCRAAHLRYWHARRSLAKATVLEAPPGTVGEPVACRISTGATVLRMSCPGIHGKPCVVIQTTGRAAYLKSNSTGNLCYECRQRIIFNGCVPTAASVAHLKALSKQGVGYKSVADAASISRSIVGKILNGQRQTIRADTERRILVIDAGAMADGAHVPARQTWKLIRQLLAVGMTKRAIARALGRPKANGLLIHKKFVCASTALKVRKLHAAIMAERTKIAAEHKPVACDGCEGPISGDDVVCAKCWAFVPAWLREALAENGSDHEMYVDMAVQWGRTRGRRLPEAA